MNNEDILKQIPIQNYPEPFISIGKVRLMRLLDEYDALKKEANFLEALRIAGVDNWQGYSQAYEVARENGLDIGDD